MHGCHEGIWTPLPIRNHLPERRLGQLRADPQHRVIRRRAEFAAAEIGEIHGADRLDVRPGDPVEHRPERRAAAAMRGEVDRVARLIGLGAGNRIVAIDDMDGFGRRFVQDGGDLGGEGGEGTSSMLPLVSTPMTTGPRLSLRSDGRYSPRAMLRRLGGT